MKVKIFIRDTTRGSKLLWYKLQGNIIKQVRNNLTNKGFNFV